MPKFMPKNNFHNFRVDDVAIRYSNFAPKLFNFCLSLGMKPNSIMPSRAFCSDENQGYPIILIAKHFGTFPFNHGRIGGIVATDRHGPHAHHGKDVVLIQASHVGYEPENGEFGIYKRLQTEHQERKNTILPVSRYPLAAVIIKTATKKWSSSIISY
jgi:hypothetical protein